VSFRYNYKLNGRQETVTLGKYGVGGITLAEARERLHEAKKLVSSGKSPAHEKQREKRKKVEATSLNAWAELWLSNYDMAASTRDMKRSVYERDIKATLGGRQLDEIEETDLRALIDKIVNRGAPATAIQVREIVMAIYDYAKSKGKRHLNPAREIKPKDIAVFKSRDRALSPAEIALMYRYLDTVGTGPQFRAAAKLLLLTLVRKSELSEAKWTEINFTDALWTIPKERMKSGKEHLVFLSDQALELFTALKVFAGGSEYVLPSRYDIGAPMSAATLNRVLEVVYKNAQKDGHDLAKFGPHDLRRTASTQLNEREYNSDWIERQLAHVPTGTREVYNKAKYAEGRRKMLQEWADLIDEWVGVKNQQPAQGAAQ
jgi:integrase